MADEIKVTKTVVYANGTLKYTYQPGTVNMPQATKGVHVQTITATTAEADVSVTQLGTPGFCLLHNLEATTTGKTWNWGPKSTTGGISTAFHKLPPKQQAQFTYGTSAQVLRGKAASGTVQVMIVTFEA